MSAAVCIQCNHPLPCLEHGEPTYTQLAIDVPDAGRRPERSFRLPSKVLPLIVEDKCQGRATGRYQRGQCKAPAKAVVERDGRRTVLCAMHLGRLGFPAGE